MVAKAVRIPMFSHHVIVTLNRSPSDTGRDAAVGGLGGAELGHHGAGNASGTHGNRDGLLGAAGGAAAGHHGAGGHTGRDAAIGGIGGELLGRRQGAAHANNNNTTGMGAAGATGGGVTGGGATGKAPSKTHGKIEEVTGKVERGLGNALNNTNMAIKGENKIIEGVFDWTYCDNRSAKAIVLQVNVNR